MTQKKKTAEILSEINSKLNTIIDLLNIQIKRFAKSSNEPKAWIQKKDREEAEKLRELNPEMYDYVIEMLKLYF